MIRLVLASIIIGLFVDSGLRSWRWWRQYRDPRSLRNFLNGVALLTGAIALWIAAYVTSFVPFGLAALIETMLWAGITVLAIVGLVNALSWRRER